MNRNVPNGVETVLSVIGDLPIGAPVPFEAAYGWGWRWNCWPRSPWPTDDTYRRIVNRQLTVQEPRHRLGRVICHGGPPGHACARYGIRISPRKPK